MSDPKKPDRKDEAGDLLGWFAKLAVGVGAAVVVGGAAYALMREVSRTPDNSYEANDATISDDFIDPTIVIAVDATSTRAGGIARIPKSKKVYYYSIDWSKIFQFKETHSDKFEMENGLLALKIFGSCIRKHKEAGDRLVLKGDNSVFKNSPGQYSHSSKKEFKHGFEKMKHILQSKPFEGRLCQASDNQDMDMKCADVLSRKDFSHVTMDPVQDIQMWLGHKQQVYKMYKFVSYLYIIDVNVQITQCKYDGYVIMSNMLMYQYNGND